MNADAIVGCLIGTAVGDALGLPFEGLTKGRAARMFRDRRRYHLVLNRGMVSDDTEHTCMVAQALMASAGDPNVFRVEMARRLRHWLARLPAGVGWATLRAIVKLWCGVPPDRSGVFSAGNAPAMRSALIGVCFGFDNDRLTSLVRAATVLTHTDPKAYWGALAVALAAHLGSIGPVSGGLLLTRLEQLLSREPADGFLDIVRQTVASVERGQSTSDFMRDLHLEKGVGGYILHTVPAALHAWMCHPDNYPEAVGEVIDCGGDTDTTGAIVGAIAGARTGIKGIPDHLIRHLCEWPMSVRWIEELGRSLAVALERREPARPPELCPICLLIRNLVFIGVVLAHGFRRLLPPF